MSQRMSQLAQEPKQYKRASLPFADFGGLDDFGLEIPLLLVGGSLASEDSMGAVEKRRIGINPSKSNHVWSNGSPRRPLEMEEIRERFVD